METDGRGKAKLALCACGLGLEVGFLAIRSLGDLEAHAVEYVAATLFSFPFYLFAVFLTLRGRWGARLSSAIWLAAVLFRLTLLPLQPTLSEDLTRYRWQARLQAAGGNPYVEVPEDPRWAELRDETWPRVTRKDLPSVYGPLAEASYRGWWEFARRLSDEPYVQVWSFKLPFAAAELGVGAALWRLLPLLGLPSSFALVYLWNPLIVNEFWAQGHNDSLAVLAVLLALIAWKRRREYSAGAWLAAAAMVKFWPLILFPFLGLRREEGRWRLGWRVAVGAAPVVVVSCALYWPEILHVRRILADFVGGWRNNDSLFGLFYDYFDEDFDRARYWSTRACVTVLALVWWRQRAVSWQFLAAIVALLAFSANCFPWYLSWFAPLLAVYPHPALLLWTALVSLEYHVLIGYGPFRVWQEDPFYRALEYYPVAALLVGRWAWRQLPSSKAPPESVRRKPIT